MRLELCPLDGELGGGIILSGFTFNSVRGHIGFRPKVRSGETFRSFSSGPPAYGTVEIGEGRAKLSLIGGALALASLGLPLAGAEATSVSLKGRPLDSARATEMRFWPPPRLSRRRLG